MENEIIKIVIIDDHPVVRGGIAKFLEKEKDFKISGEAESANDAIKLIDEVHPDIAIIDLALKGDADGIELIKAVKSRFPGVRTLCLSMFEESVYAERAIRAGAKGYIQKNADPENVIKAIRRIMDGKLYLSEDISDTIISKLMHGRPQEATDSQVDVLSDREFEVFLLIGNGYGTKEISKRMNLSPHTVESHRKNIKEKMNIKDAADLNKISVQWVLTHNKKI